MFSVWIDLRLRIKQSSCQALSLLLAQISNDASTVPGKKPLPEAGETGVCRLSQNGSQTVSLVPRIETVSGVTGAGREFRLGLRTEITAGLRLSAGARAIGDRGNGSLRDSSRSNSVALQDSRTLCAVKGMSMRRITELILGDYVWNKNRVY